MHRAWNIVDVQLEILERLEAQDLSRLARTCKTLFSIATDELWKTLYSMSPFMCCLPPDFKHRELVAKDIQRLQTYSQKVKILAIESPSKNNAIGLPIASNVIDLPRPFNAPNRKKKLKAVSGGKSWEQLWEEINNIRPASEFLPNLRRLRFNNAIERLLIPLVGISGSNLNYICIKYIHQRHGGIVENLLDRFQNTPNLEYLFVRDGEPDLVPRKLIKQSPLHHLRLDPRVEAVGLHGEAEYKKHSLRPEILEKSTLEHLNLGSTSEWFSTKLNTPDGKYLPNLKSLWLDLSTLEPQDCATQLKSPALFLEGLDQPELDVLNIKFSTDIDGAFLSEVVNAARNSCQLQNLSQLALAGRVWIEWCRECGRRPQPGTSPQELRDAFSMLLPLPCLKTLKLSVAPNFLDVLDLELYRDFASKLISLETLRLGHKTFGRSGSHWTNEVDDYREERVPLHHLAAFCCLLPNLTEVSVGVVDCIVLEDAPRSEWSCTSVERLIVGRWLREEYGTVFTNKLGLSLRTYFPESDLAKEGGYP